MKVMVLWASPCLMIVINSGEACDVSCVACMIEKDTAIAQDVDSVTRTAVRL
jgi:hypothetical protein